MQSFKVKVLFIFKVVCTIEMQYDTYRYRQIGRRRSA